MSSGGGRNGNGDGFSGGGTATMEPNTELLERPSYGMMQASAEVDTQVATAKRFPRSIKAFKENALSLATLDIETAASCFYVLPARKGGDGKAIEGPSIRMAEIVASAWGNIRVKASIVADDGDFITVEGRCWDLEKNVAMSAEVRRRVVDKYGKRYSPDMISTTTNAACSIAIRNAVFLVVPRALFNSVLAQARKVAIGDATTLVKRRADMLAYFSKMGVSAERVCHSVDKPSIEDITVDDLAALLGISTAIRDGDTTVDEAFPPIDKTDKKEPPKTASDALASQIVGDGKKSETTKPAETVTDPIETIKQKIEAAMTKDALFEIEKDIGKISDDDTRTKLYLLSSDRQKKLPGT